MEETVWNNFLTESEKEFTDLFQESKINNIKKKVKSGVNKIKEKFNSGKKENTNSDKKENKKSGLDSLNTVSKGSTGKEKVKEASKKVSKQVKQTVKNPIKTGTIVGAAVGGITGGAVGFGVGNMVKDISDGVKEVKSKLNESLVFESNLTEKLQIILADLHLLVQTTHNFHWNIISPSFYEYHKLFDVHYEDLNILIDDWAEYLRQLDIKPNGNYSDYLILSNLQEPENGENYTDYEMFEKLKNDYIIFLKYLESHILKNENINDEILKDKINNIYQICSKQNWMIKSTLQNMDKSFNKILFESNNQFNNLLSKINRNNFS